MAKNYKKSISISVNGIYYLEDGVPMIEIEDYGNVKLTEILESVEDESISFSVKVVNEVTEDRE